MVTSHLPDGRGDAPDERLEAYLDGELSVEEAAEVEARLAGDARWRAELARARAVRDGLRALPRPACPPAVTAAVLAHARRETRRRPLTRLARAFGGVRRIDWRPALAMAVLAGLVVASALIDSGARRSGTPHDGALAAIPPAEVEAALEEARWALAYVSEVGRRTGRSVREAAFDEPLVAPVTGAVKSILPQSQDRADL